MKSKQWHSTEVTTTRENCEAIEYGLMEAGALGTETVDLDAEVRITAYFDSPVDEKKVHRALVDAWRLYNHPPDDLKRVGFRLRAVADRDWLAEWKKSWQPVPVGRFVIAPPWMSNPPAVANGSKSRRETQSEPLDPVATAPGSDTIIIRINPGMAFGTGTHETTRLCLQAIDKYFRGGSFLDVGTGTGVLAIAATKMCQKSDRQAGQPAITACDTDADAINIAKENAALNDVADKINFRVGSVDDQTPSADFVCANLTAPVIVELLPALIGASCGRLVLSGILDSQVEMVQSRLAQLSVTQFEVEQDGEWTAIVA